MNNLLSETKYLCQKYGLYPQRQSGQNFLINENVFNQIINAANLTKEDYILEIGAGFGSLTKRLAEKVKKVWAVELEKRFLPALSKLSQAYPNLEVIRGNILELNIPKLIRQRDYKIVANLPYNITSHVLRKFLEQEPKPEEMTILLQKEVAERIVALPGALSLLAVAVQFYSEPKIIQVMGKENFWPRPKVASALVKITKIKNSAEVRKELTRLEMKRGKQTNFPEKDFFQVVRAGFSAKRKQIHNNFANSFHIENNKIKKILAELAMDIRIRPQNLSIKEWKKLTFCFKKAKII